MVALSSESTGVRVDAQNVWIVPRSPRSKIPAGVRKIDIKSAYPSGAPIISRHIIDPGQLRKIIQWIDALEVVQPGTYSCPRLSGPTVTFDFRGPSGAPLAQASVLYLHGTSGPCNPIKLTLRGHTQTPLIGDDLLRRIERLLDIRLNPAPTPRGG